MKNNKGTWIILGILVVVGLIVVISVSSSSSTPPTVASLPHTQQSICSSDIATLKTQAKTVDFKQLNKDPDSFKGTPAVYTGQIVQIQESNGQGVIRMSVTKESYGWSFSDIIYVAYQGYTDAVEDDVVTVYGYNTGSYTYTSQANFQITVPSFVACEVDKGYPVSTKPATVKSVPSTQSSANTTQYSQPQTPVKSTPVVTPVTSTAPQAPVSNETVSQTNAVKKAKSYLNYSAFSHDGLIDQLEYDQFSYADAVYGADNSGANWNEQAAAKAKSYMEYSAFSRGSLIAQLEYDKFTQAQAEYGANAVGL